MTKTQEIRFDAIRALVDQYIAHEDGALLSNDRQAFVDGVAALRPLGRTERWKYALTKWMDMVAEHPEDFKWAVLQGSVYAGYAV